MILYFSGTGNSRYSAILLGNALNDEVVSLNERISSTNSAAVCSEKPLVFVVPTYCYHIPAPIEEYIRRTEFKAGKTYFVMTCGAGVGGAGAANKALCSEKGLEYMGTYTLVMPDNYLVMYEPSSRDEAEACLAELPQKISDIADVIKSGNEFKDKKQLFGRQISVMGSKIFNSALVKPEKFSVSESCISCGQCAAGCPLNNISICDGTPKWGDSCVHCLACICGCPQNAIEYGKATTNRRRHYLFPDGSLK